MILNRGYQIHDNYKVLFSINSGTVTETYRVKNSTGSLGFLKIINLSKLDPYCFTDIGELVEKEILSSIDSPKVPQFIAQGELYLSNNRYFYLITEFISGESLNDRLKRELRLDSTNAVFICIEILETLEFLHNMQPGIIHNAVRPENIMLDLSTGSAVAKLCGFGSARYINQPRDAFPVKQEFVHYIPNEGLNGVFTSQSDLFSVGCLLYHMLFGVPPWYTDILIQSKGKLDINAVYKARRRPLSKLVFSDERCNIPDSIMEIINTATHYDVSIRYANAKDFSSALSEAMNKGTSVSEDRSNMRPFTIASTNTENDDKSSCGFSQVAGMQELKRILTNDVLKILQDREGAEEYGITIPNGILLYGPPGCGKTFIAEKFSEEAGYHYYFVKTSDLSSIYIHGSQEKIGALFKEARSNKPAIICFDEIDALVPNRDSINNASMSGEVNEFLTQLNNCGKQELLVIGTTNRPDLIDPAVLRKGRFDQLIYVPPPDFEARKGMFKIYLDNRPLDFGIDFDKLSELTEGRACSDIEFIVNEVARRAYHRKSRIDQDAIIAFINDTPSSLSPKQLASFAQLNEKLRNNSSVDKTNIGFVP